MRWSNSGRSVGHGIVRELLDSDSTPPGRRLTRRVDDERRNTAPIFRCRCIGSRRRHLGEGASLPAVSRRLSSCLFVCICLLLFVCVIVSVVGHAAFTPRAMGGTLHRGANPSAPPHPPSPLAFGRRMGGDCNRVSIGGGGGSMGGWGGWVGGFQVFCLLPPSSPVAPARPGCASPRGLLLGGVVSDAVSVARRVPAACRWLISFELSSVPGCC